MAKKQIDPMARKSSISKRVTKSKHFIFFDPGNINQYMQNHIFKVNKMNCDPQINN
jgi:hypothetical protein